MTLPLFSRRTFFKRAGAGFAGLALIDLLSRDGLFAQSPGALRPSARHAAKHCVFLFMNGALSHVDTVDRKPALTRYPQPPIAARRQLAPTGGPSAI